MEGDAVVYRSRRGRVVCWGMIITLVAFLILLYLFRDITAVAVIVVALCAALEAYLWWSPYLYRYSFGDEGFTVDVIGLWDEPPVRYDRVWKVVDSDRVPYSSNLHGASNDAIQIWYDRGTGHYVCISPDKGLVMPILRERCAGAEFEVVRR